MEDPQIVKKYLEHLLEYISRHDILTKMQTILDQLLDKNDLTNAIHQKLNNIDTLRIQGMLAAE